MEQHPIPQQISSYEFKLVGDMTLKQFLKAAAGIVLAVIINASHLIFFLKWPLMIICGGGGLALAFVPFQDRPLESWIVTFIRSIYSPTIYIYKKTVDKSWTEMSRGKSAADKKAEVEEEEAVVPVKNNQKVKEFIESLPGIKVNYLPEEKKETTKNEPNILVDNGSEKIEEKEVVLAEKKVIDWRDQKPGLNLKTQKLGATGTAVFGAIPMPDKPDVANLVVGMVTNLEGKIIEGAIVEIQDEKGNPSRVLKTNPLGQFKTTAPLADGKYLVITEKEGFEFDRVNIELVGKIVDPVKIQAKA